ncbi:MAG: inositol monophosphatase [Hydrogenothermaceae bacterium]|nr:inositol monophosphatase [Hydrogenothermaceae bacterium]
MSFLQVAKEAAVIGGSILKENFKKIKQSDVESKGVKDFVTYVDRLSEERIRNYILSIYPDHSFLGEEEGTFGKSEFVWIVDPLDGTKNYISGFEIFAVSVALKREDEFLASAIYIPMLDKLYYAEKGSGAYLNGQRIKVSNRPIQNAVVATGFPFRNIKELDSYISMLKKAMITFSGVRRPGAAAIDLALVAEGVFDGFFEMKLSIWDIAAGALLIEEAGGIYSNFEGEKDLSDGNIIAGGPDIYKVLFDMVNSESKE